MARGSHEQEIFQDDRDRQRFLEMLGEACAKTGFRIHAYVLIVNHYHLLCRVVFKARNVLYLANQDNFIGGDW